MKLKFLCQKNNHKDISFQQKSYKKFHSPLTQKLHKFFLFLCEYSMLDLYDVSEENNTYFHASQKHDNESIQCKM